MKHKTDWNLGLMYKSLTDQKIEKDISKIENSCKAFEKKYSKNRSYLSNEKILKTALKNLEEIYGLQNPYIFLHLFLDINKGNEKAESLKNKISQRLTTAYNRILFFKLSLSSISKNEQKKFLESKDLVNFQYFLKNIFLHSKYNLTEAEEKIINLKNLVSNDLWVSGQEKLLNKQTVNFKGKNLPISEALGIIKSLPAKERTELHKKSMEKLKSISDFSESEINAIVIDKKIDDELRGYSKPYSSTVLGYQNTEAEVESLVKTVTDNFSVAQRFYKIKSKILKIKEMSYADRSVSIGKNNKKIEFSEAVSIINNAFGKLGDKYKNIFESYINNGQIDVFPKKGKSGGAYCWSNVNLPTYVLLNYTNDTDSVSTLAHEMGHAIHGELSKTQPVIYQGHTISVAEVASTFFENFAFEEMFQIMSDSEKIVALHDRITDDIQTIFRQIALFNFEIELHNTIRKNGAMSKEEIAVLMNKHMKSYLGPAFKLKEEDGYFFVTWSHIRRYFYVYSYAYGQLISKALYKKYKDDSKYFSKIETFLSAGESKSPKDIFKDIGIDVTNPKFFEDGIKSINEDISRLEKLIKKTK